MTMSAVVVTILDLVFLGLFAVAARDFWRRRDSVRLAVLLVFGCLATVLVGAVIERVVPAATAAVGLVSSAAILGEPVAALWLVSHFWAPARRFITAALVLFALIAMFVVYTTVFGVAVLAPIMGGLAVLFGAYFGVFELLAAAGLAIESRRRAGSSRVRMTVGALATFALGVALVALIVGGTLPATQGNAGLEVVIELLALGAALGYLVAFAPPRLLRRVTQQTIAFDFIRELSAIPAGAGGARIWALLAQTAVRSTGATRVVVLLGRDAVATADSSVRSRSTVRMEIALPGLDTPAPARLELRFRGRPLFVEDDEELLRLVADRTWKSVEREEAIRQRDSLIAELRAAGTARSDELAAICQELRAPVVAMMASSARLLEAADRAADRGAGPMSAHARTEVGSSASAWAAEDHARARDDAEHIHFASERLLARIDRLLDAPAPAPAPVAPTEGGEAGAADAAEDASSAERAARAPAERAATIVQAAGL